MIWFANRHEFNVMIIIVICKKEQGNKERKNGRGGGEGESKWGRKRDVQEIKSK